MREDLPAAGSQDPGGLHGIFRHAHEPRQHDDHHEGRPVPDFDEDHRSEGRDGFSQPGDSDLSRDEEAQDLVDRALLVEEHLEGKADDHRDGEHWNDEEHVVEAPAAEGLLQEKGQTEAEQNREEGGKAREDKRASEGRQEPLFGQDLQEEVQPDEACGPPGSQVCGPLMEGEVDLEAQDRNQERHRKDKRGSTPPTGRTRPFS